MKDLDKTKQNIRIDDIEENQRKDLFNKFRNAGGEVLSEREKRRSMIIDRNKQKQYQKRLDEHYNSKKTTSAVSNKRAPQTGKGLPVAVPLTSTAYERFRIRMRLRLQGITGMNTGFFKNSYFDRFINHYRPSLMELQTIYLALFKKDPSTGNRIIRSLDKISPLYYELIEKSGDLFESYSIDQILEGYRSFPDLPQGLSELRDLMTELFRKIFLLKPYENTLYNAFEKAIDLNISYSEEKKGKTIRKKDVKNALFIIFNKLYPRLHTLFCQYNNFLFTELDKGIEDRLSIIQSEKPGNRIRTSVQQQLSETAVYEETPSGTEEEKVIQTVDPSVREGLKMMYRLDNSTLRRTYDRKGEFELISNSDKVLLSYMLFLEFESEYSFILTTNRIKYNVDFSTSSKVDYRTKMQDIFNQLNKCRESFRSYHDACIEYNKIYNQKPLSNSQYIAYSKRLDEVNMKKKRAGGMSRMIIKTFMDNLSAELKVLSEDMDSNQRYISNPQDIIEFNYEIEGDKKLKDKKVYEAIQITMNFADALSFRLGPEGDLSGNLEFKDNERQLEVADENSGSAVSETDYEGDETQKSILDELDDII